MIARLASVVLVSLLASFVATNAAAPRARADDRLHAWTGAYRFAGGAGERARLRAELDRVANQLGFIVRDVARGRLHDEVRIDERVAIELRGETLRVRIGTRVLVDCDDSERTILGHNGERGEGRCTISRGRVVVRVVYEDATQTYTLARSGDGTTLHVRVTIAASPLPDDIRYRLTYRR
jgi:hypothetical protein